MTTSLRAMLWRESRAILGVRVCVRAGGSREGGMYVSKATGYRGENEAKGRGEREGGQRVQRYIEHSKGADGVERGGVQDEKRGSEQLRHSCLSQNLRTLHSSSTLTQATFHSGCTSVHLMPRMHTCTPPHLPYRLLLVFRLPESSRVVDLQLAQSILKSGMAGGHLAERRGRGVHMATSWTNELNKV